MATNYDQLKKAITDTIKTNGIGGITGSILQARLLEIVTAIIEEAANITSKQSAISGLSQTSWDAVKSDAAKVSSKQDKLVSGINIKNINGQSILGSGNLVIPGGSGETIVQTVQSDWNEADPSSGAYIQNKPTIPDAVTESTVTGWGFYAKPSSGIPVTDLASDVQASLIPASEYNALVTQVNQLKTTIANLQSAISDIATIRSDAQLGATAHGWGNHADERYAKLEGATFTGIVTAPKFFES